MAPCTGEMGGDFSTSNRGSKMVVQTGFVPMGYLGIGAKVGGSFPLFQLPMS